MELFEFKVALRNILEEELPFRNRVEVYATKDGKVYGGFYPDGGFGVFGGGTDGEKLEDAATREFKEESGYKVKNLKKLDIPAVEAIWDEAKSKKQKERMQEYKGTRTWYFHGELDDSGKKNKATGEDGQSSLKEIGLIEIDDAIKALEKEPDDPNLKKQYKARIKALKLIKDML
jgi:8-oxo-dGTP pyrophosphatase MutT (NUDIX family)